MLVGARGVVDRVGGHGEDVGRGREEGERDVAAAGQQPSRQFVDGDADPHVGGAVGVDVVADHERARLLAEPVGEGRHLGEQVGARLPVGDGRDQVTGALTSRGADAVPHRLAGQVDGRDPRPPPAQRLQRTHLGPRTHDRDGVALEPQPLGVRLHLGERLGHRGLDDAGLHPAVHLPPQVVAAQPVAAVGQHQLLHPLPRAAHLEPPARRRRLRPLAQGQVRRARLGTRPHPHALVQ